MCYKDKVGEASSTARGQAPMIDPMVDGVCACALSAPRGAETSAETNALAVWCDARFHSFSLAVMPINHPGMQAAAAQGKAFPCHACHTCDVGVRDGRNWLLLSHRYLMEIGGTCALINVQASGPDLATFCTGLQKLPTSERGRGATHVDDLQATCCGRVSEESHMRNACRPHDVRGIPVHTSVGRHPELLRQ